MNRLLTVGALSFGTHVHAGNTKTGLLQARNRMEWDGWFGRHIAVPLSTPDVFLQKLTWRTIAVLVLQTSDPSTPWLRSASFIIAGTPTGTN